MATKRAATESAKRVRRTPMRRKNLILNQDKIDRAKTLFGVATETEAIHRALEAAEDLATFRQEIDRGLDQLVGRGGFTDRFPHG